MPGANLSQSLETPCLSCALHLTVNTAGGIWRKVRLSSEGERARARRGGPVQLVFFQPVFRANQSKWESIPAAF